VNGLEAVQDVWQQEPERNLARLGVGRERSKVARRLVDSWTFVWVALDGERDGLVRPGVVNAHRWEVGAQTSG
jgi:hypothetical protein